MEQQLGLELCFRVEQQSRMEQQLEWLEPCFRPEPCFRLEQCFRVEQRFSAALVNFLFRAASAAEVPEKDQSHRGQIR